MARKPREKYPVLDSDKPTFTTDETFDMRDQIAVALRKYDEMASKESMSTGLEKMWYQIGLFSDTNDLVRINLYQMQLLVQKVFSKHIESETERESLLSKLQREARVDTSPEKIELLNSTSKRIQGERRADVNQITQLIYAAKTMAKEYRECKLNQQYYVHVSKVQEFALMLKAAIMQNIHNPETIERIKSAMDEACVKLFTPTK